MVDKCFECGTCCKLFLINLTEEEYKSGKYKTQFEIFDLIDDFKKAEECGANIIKQREDGSCIYLKKSKCSIHQIRPESCRDFFCKSKNKKFKEMIEMIKKYKIKNAPACSRPRSSQAHTRPFFF
ncbi:MAG: YkgJ family cysteine cluster protein [Nanoarchaeota archaeon]|nr:YkgJ family cysteine cluster protein [Nanoarchaeota archaeon]